MRIALTTPDSRLFEVDPSMIKMLEVVTPHMFAASANSVLYIGPDLHMQAVKETVAQIKALEAKK